MVSNMYVRTFDYFFNLNFCFYNTFSNISPFQPPWQLRASNSLELKKKKLKKYFCVKDMIYIFLYFYYRIVVIETKVPTENHSNLYILASGWCVAESYLLRSEVSLYILPIIRFYYFVTKFWIINIIYYRF